MTGRVRYVARITAMWVATFSGTWTVLRLVGLPADLAAALVGGAGLVAGGIVSWALVVEPRLFAPRPSIRPRVLPGPADGGKTAPAAVYVASYVTKTGQVIDVEARPDRGGVR